MGLRVSDHQIDAGGHLPLGGFEHGVGLADPGDIPEEDLQLTPLRPALFVLQASKKVVRIGTLVFVHGGS